MRLCLIFLLLNLTSSAVVAQSWDGLFGGPSQPNIQTTMTLWTSGNCKYCPAVEKTVTRLKNEGWPVDSASCDQYPDLAKQWGVARVPTCIFKDNQNVELHRVVGSTTYAVLLQLLKDYGAMQVVQPVVP